MDYGWNCNVETQKKSWYPWTLWRDLNLKHYWKPWHTHTFNAKYIIFWQTCTESLLLHVRHPFSQKATLLASNWFRRLLSLNSNTKEKIFSLEPHKLGHVKSRKRLQSWTSLLEMSICVRQSVHPPKIFYTSQIHKEDVLFFTSGLDSFVQHRRDPNAGFWVGSEKWRSKQAIIIGSCLAWIG